MNLMLYGKAFVFGGLICVVGELLLLFTRLTSARILVLFVVLGVVLSALGLYEPFVDFAGAGATVPLTGFGHSLFQGVRLSILKGDPLAVLSGGLAATSTGIAAAILFAFLGCLLNRSHTKI